MSTAARRGLGVLGLRRQRVRLAVELLHQEVEPPAGRLVACERLARPRRRGSRSRSSSSSTSRRASASAISCSRRSRFGSAGSVSCASRSSRRVADARPAPPAAARAPPRSAPRAARSGCSSIAAMRAPSLAAARGQRGERVASERGCGRVAAARGRAPARAARPGQRSSSSAVGESSVPPCWVARRVTSWRAREQLVEEGLVDLERRAARRRGRGTAASHRPCRGAPPPRSPGGTRPRASAAPPGSRKPSSR